MAVALRQLVWLRWRLLTRGMHRGKARWVGVVVLLLLVAPWSLAIGAGLFFALYSLPIGVGRVTGEMALQAALTFASAIWVTAPLLGFTLNDAYDITRLFIYPVSRQRIYVGTLLGSLMDGSTLFLLPGLLGATAALWLRSPAAGAAATIAMPLFLLQTLALSQGIVLAMQGILKSRKARDIALIVFPLLMMAYQVGNQFFVRSMTGGKWQVLLSSPIVKSLTLLPSGMAAHAVGSAGRSEWAPAAGWLLLLGTVTAITVRVCGALVARAYEGESVGPAPRAERGEASRAARGVDPLDRLPAATAAVLRKEWRIFQREPHFRLLLMNLVFSVGFAAFMTFSRSQRVGSVGGSLVVDGILLGGVGLVLMQQSAILFNQFGHDGFASALLFGFPARRRDILLGKNLALLSALTPLHLLLGPALCLLAGRIDAAPLLVLVGVLSTVVQIAIGNVLSLAFPFRLVLRNFRGRQQATGMGAGRGLLYLAVTLAASLLLLPIAAAVALPRHWIDSAWFGLTLPLAIVYAGGLYALSLKLFEPLIADRELWVVERLTQSEA